MTSALDPELVDEANGPWGREFQQNLERLYTPCACRDLPLFLLQLARRVPG